MHALIALIRKDLQLFLRNRRAILMTVLAPILIAAFFGSLFGSDARVSQLAVALSDEDGSALSRQIVQAMRADASLQLQEMPAAQALEAVRAGRLKAAVTLPPGFAQAATRAVFGAGAKPEILVVYDPSQSTVLPLVRGLVAQHVSQRVMQSAFSSGGAGLAGMRRDVSSAPPLAPDRRQDLLAILDSIERVQAADAATGAASSAAGAGTPAGSGLGAPFATREVQAAGAGAALNRAAQGYNAYAHSFAGMGVQFILMQGVEFGVALLLMRRSALWLRLRAAPVTRAQVLGARLLSGAIISAAVFTVVLGVAIAFFGVRVQGSWTGLAAIVTAFALMTSAFGLMIAAIGRSPEATRGLAILATLLLVMVGGAWVPSFLFPPWLQTVSAWTPTHWAVQGLDAMTWRARPLAEVWAPVAVQLGCGALFAGIALLRFRWDE